MSENKTNFIIAIRGYKIIKKQKNANFTDFTASDDLNNKVLLRIIEPLDNEYIGISYVNDTAEFIKQEKYDSAILISKKFTDTAVKTMANEKIQHISDDYMPPFHIEELYSAIIDCVNRQCMKKCGKVNLVKSDCTEKKVDLCRTSALAGSARSHFEDGLIGLLKNDLKMAFALNK
jgi:hypothetical protein